MTRKQKIIRLIICIIATCLIFNLLAVIAKECDYYMAAFSIPWLLAIQSFLMLYALFPFLSEDKTTV